MTITIQLPQEHKQLAGLSTHRSACWLSLLATGPVEVSPPLGPECWEAAAAGEAVLTGPPPWMMMSSTALAAACFAFFLL